MSALTLSSFEQALCKITVGEYDAYHLYGESDLPLARRIEQYWVDIDQVFPGTAIAWSGVFVSSCLLRAGASHSEFHFSPRHAVYVKACIGNAHARRGVFQAYPINECVPTVGDIIQNNRSGNNFDYDHAATNSKYESHCAIVVEEGRDATGRFVTTIGGNESDSIRRKRIALHEDGTIKQREKDPYICVIQTLK